MSMPRHTLTRRSFVSLQAAALVSLLSGCAPGAEEDARKGGGPLRSLEDIRENGLRVGVCSDEMPLDYIGSRGNYDGYAKHFCLYLSEDTGIGVEYFAMDPRDRYSMLESHEVDLVLTSMSPADARADAVLFAHPLLHLALGVVSPKSAPVDRVEQLAEKELIVCEGTYAEQYVKGCVGDTKLKSYPTLTDAYLALEGGHGAALVGDELGILAWLKGKDDYVLSLRDFTAPRDYAPAMAAGSDDLRVLLDGVVDGFISSGNSKKAFEKYIEKNILGGYYTADTLLCKSPA